MTLDEILLGSLMTQSDIQAAMTAQGYTAARAGYLDELGSSVLGTAGHLPVLDANQAFPAAALVNAPRTGMSLADASTVLGPAALAVNKLIGDEDIYVPVFKNHTARLCAYIALDGADIQQTDVSTIVYNIYLLDNNDPDVRTAVAGHTNISLTPADVLFDTLQSDSQASGYNFRHVIPVSVSNAFTIAGRNYLVEYALTPVPGERILVRFRVNVL